MPLEDEKNYFKKLCLEVLLKNNSLFLIRNQNNIKNRKLNLHILLGASIL